jgi:SSS family solute:Na+ symporter
MPFLNRMGIVFLLLTVIMVVISLMDPKGKDNPKAIEFDKEMLTTSTSFKIGAIAVCMIFAALYIIFW